MSSMDHPSTSMEAAQKLSQSLKKESRAQMAEYNQNSARKPEHLSALSGVQAGSRFYYDFGKTRMKRW